LWLASGLRGSAQRLIGIETAVADRLSAMRGPGDSHSDVILRLVEIEAKAGR
jgi:predicted CopG family antitoxin